MIRGEAGAIGAQMISATTGAAFTSAVTAYLTGDAGTQAITTTNSGVCVHEGNGYHTQTLTALETDYDLIAVTFVGTGAIPVTIQIVPNVVATLTPTIGAPATGAISATDILSDAFAELNVFLPSETLPAADAAFGLRSLNNLLSAWSQQTLTIPSVTRNIFPLVADQGSTTTPYTIGSGGDFDIGRPANAFSLKYAANLFSDAITESPLVLLDDVAWTSWPNKDLSGTMASHLHYSATFTDGLGTIHLWPVPDNTTYPLVLYLDAPLTTFADLTTSYQVPPGYADALIFSLARRLATPYGRDVTSELREKAESALRLIKRGNLVPVEMVNAFAAGGSYDLQSDRIF